MYTIDGTDVYPDNGNAPSMYAAGFALARLGRFGNQCKHWYPVLAHTYTVTDLVDDPYKIHALLHDTAESVFGDIVATWKTEDEIEREEHMLKMIYNDLGVPLPTEDEYNVVHEADLAARSAEAVLLGHSTPNEKFFVEIRNANEELYENALSLTRHNMESFTAEKTIPYHYSVSHASFFSSLVNVLVRELKANV